MIRLAKLLTILAVPFIAVALNVWLVASTPYLHWVYGRPDFPAAQGFGDAERLELATPSTLYLVRPISRADLARLTHAGLPLYTAEELDHLVDVKRLVGQFSLLALLGLTILFFGAEQWRRGRLPGWPKALARGGWLTLAIVVVVGSGIALAWPLVFTGFHELFFQPGTWSFSTESGLITLFPVEFWFLAAVCLAGFAAVEGLLVGLVGAMIGRFEPRQRRSV